MIGLGVLIPRVLAAMLVQTIMHADDFTDIHIEFDIDDLQTFKRNNQVYSTAELFFNWCEYKTELIHGIITEPLYAHQIITLSIVDEPYELLSEFTISADNHVPNVSDCTFCDLDFLINN